jgi:hypothetical protein
MLGMADKVETKNTEVPYANWTTEQKLARIKELEKEIK